jgi:hypothetical protein
MGLRSPMLTDMLRTGTQNNASHAHVTEDVTGIRIKSLSVGIYRKLLNIVRRIKNNEMLC